MTVVFEWWLILSQPGLVPGAGKAKRKLGVQRRAIPFLSFYSVIQARAMPSRPFLPVPTLPCAKAHSHPCTHTCGLG
jgi:hypothetical protein